MTREEALEILDRIPTIGEQVDALDMAIEALEQRMNISKEDFATLCICAIRYGQGRKTYMPSLVQGIVRSHFGDIPDNYLNIMLCDCDFQRTMELYGDEHIDKPGWLRWEQDLKDEIRRRKDET